jgi:hypothetical protein
MKRAEEWRRVMGLQPHKKGILWAILDMPGGKKVGTDLEAGEAGGGITKKDEPFSGLIVDVAGGKRSRLRGSSAQHRGYMGTHTALRTFQHGFVVAGIRPRCLSNRRGPGG